MIRSAVERLARGWCWWRRLPADCAGVGLYVSGYARLRNLLPGREAFDPALLARVRATVKPEASIWDIGANVGVFTFAAAGRWLGRFLPRTSDVRIVPSPLLVADPAVTKRNVV